MLAVWVMGRQVCRRIPGVSRSCVLTRRSRTVIQGDLSFLELFSLSPCFEFYRGSVGVRWRSLRCRSSGSTGSGLGRVIAHSFGYSARYLVRQGGAKGGDGSS